jgi:hypothetical protein
MLRKAPSLRRLPTSSCPVIWPAGRSECCPWDRGGVGEGQAVWWRQRRRATRREVRRATLREPITVMPPSSRLPGAPPEHQRRPYTTALALRERLSGIVEPWPIWSTHTVIAASRTIDRGWPQPVFRLPSRSREAKCGEESEEGKPYEGDHRHHIRLGSQRDGRNKDGAGDGGAERRTEVGDAAGES